MTLEELLVRLIDEDILDRIEVLYPGSEEHREDHRSALLEIRRTVPAAKERFSIGLSENLDDFDGRIHTHVSGYPEGSAEAHAMEFSPWSEWLAMEFLPATITAYTPVDLMAHCLWEMTFCGYSAAEVSGELEELRHRYEDAVAHPENLIPWEDVRDEILGKSEEDFEDVD